MLPFAEVSLVEEAAYPPNSLVLFLTHSKSFLFCKKPLYSGGTSAHYTKASVMGIKFSATA